MQIMAVSICDGSGYHTVLPVRVTTDSDGKVAASCFGAANSRRNSKCDDFSYASGVDIFTTKLVGQRSRVENQPMYTKTANDAVHGC